MAYPSDALLFLIIFFSFSHACQSCPVDVNYECPDFHGTALRFPFTNGSLSDCGYCALQCQNGSSTIQCGVQELSYPIEEIFPSNNTIVLVFPGLHDLLGDVCKVHQNDSVVIPTPPYTTFKILHLTAFIRCRVQSRESSSLEGSSVACGNDVVHGPYAEGEVPKNIPPYCSVIQLPNSTNDYFSIQYQLPDACSGCANDRSRCYDPNKKQFQCPGTGNRNLAIILGTVSAGSLIIFLVILILCWHQRRIKIGPSLSSALFSRRRSDLEDGCMNGLTLFSYNELKEATNNFDAAGELGEGGFGIVYYGKLKDGREVAVKRLYERNFKRIEQFKNEIHILTGLRHKNLVNLYGCTSRHSRELLLVYEYIPNGTVANHLHGDNASSELINWSTRMNIAIETAEALSFLHFKDIIHRDVKTCNILLDKNFSVKVVDFGLSRLFPADVTHVSTAPQGTAGYVDPEYYQCYHLTNKSDVYSFGVVLVELISSLPAVDIERHRDEINLSTYAMNRIQSCAFNELVDPRLGFETDFKVQRMTTLVGELAFQCLQHVSELRPSMDEVLEALKRIASADYVALEAEGMIVETKEVKKPRKSPPPSSDYVKDEILRSQQPPSTDSITGEWSRKSKKPLSSSTENEVGMAKSAQTPPLSPDSVMDKWLSKSSTPNISS